MKVAVLGGSFNPPHVAHLLAATWVLSTADIDEVWFVPVGYHAFGKRLAPFNDRLAMTRLATRTISHCSRVLDIESRLGGENRTIDTLQRLEQEHPGVRFSLIIGADILQERTKWKSWDILERDYGFHVLGRSGVDTPDGGDLAITLPEVSSTQIRANLASGEHHGLQGMVDRQVLSYITERGLYAEAPQPGQSI